MKLKVISENGSREFTQHTRSNLELTLGRYRQAISDVVVNSTGKRCSVRVRLRSNSLVLVAASEKDDLQSMRQALGRAAREVRRRFFLARELNFANDQSVDRT